MGRAQIQSSLFQQRIESLQASDKNQHSVGRDKSRLANDREKKSIVEKVGVQHHAVDALPKNQG